MINDLQHTDGDKNIGGIAEQHYVAYMKDILTFPRPTATPVNPGDTQIVTENFVFKTGKCFSRLYCTLETGEINDDAQGERDCYSFLNKAMTFFPGSKKESLEVGNQIKNSSLCVVMRENNGQLRILGSPELPATAKVFTKGGKKTSDAKGVHFEITAPSETIAFIYMGDISLTPAS